MNCVEPPYKGDLGFKNIYLKVSDLAPHVLDMFVREFKSKYKTHDLDLDKWKYIMFMHRKDGWIHEWCFTSKNEGDLEKD